MTDYQKAIEAADRKAHEAYYDAVNADGVISQKSTHLAIDAALSAFEAHGLVLVPRAATIGMIAAMADANAKHGGMATPAQEYTAMVEAALQERQKK